MEEVRKTKRIRGWMYRWIKWLILPFVLFNIGDAITFTVMGISREGNPRARAIFDHLGGYAGIWVLKLFAVTLFCLMVWWFAKKIPPLTIPLYSVLFLLTVFFGVVFVHQLLVL